MKAYKSLTDDSLRLFRPDMNMKRLASSMDRLHMPGSDFPHDEMIKCITKLVQADEKWIPYGEGYSLYLRPTAIATHKFLGLAAPDSVLLYVITSPVGPYYKSGFKPIRLTADTPYIRAWPGGTGDAKVGGNYGPAMKAQAEAAANGYSQVLWLFGDDDEITEVGAMNVFFFLINKETNRPELVTAPLTRGDILPGVTRDSILQLAKAWGDFDVSERFLTMAEVQEAAEEGRLIGAFGAGTAAVISPISCIQYKGKDIEIPTTGDLTTRIWDEITGIQYGKIEGPEGWSVKVEKEAYECS
jgi:branched-chain amino acid aminotransferase